MNRLLTLPGTLLLTAIVSAPLAAQTLKTFTNGTVADANAVNDNFAALKSSLDTANSNAGAAQAVATTAQATADAAQAAVTTLTNAITVSGANVGVGATSPGERLDVAGNIRIGGGTTTTPGDRIWFGTPLQNDGDSTYLQRVDTDVNRSRVRMVIGNDGLNGGFVDVEDKFSISSETTTGVVDRITFETRGRIGVFDDDPVAQLSIRVEQAQSTPSGPSGLDIATTGGNHWRIHHSGSYLRFSNSLSDGGAYTNVAYVDYASGAWTTVSDRRLKTDIAPVGDVLDRLSQVNVVRYRLKAASDAPQTLGVIAQEVQELFPEIVTQGESSDYLGVNYSGLGVLAVKGVQEQQGMIEDLKAENADLQARLAELERSNESLRQRVGNIEALQAQIDSLKAAVTGK